MFVAFGREKVPEDRDLLPKVDPGSERIGRFGASTWRKRPIGGRLPSMRTRLAHAATLAGTLVLGAGVCAQPSGAKVARGWDVIVTVRKDGVGADIVSVGARDSAYPPELLRKQMVDLGARLGQGGARGVFVSQETLRAGEPASSVVRGTCGVDGLIDASGRLYVAPIAQAFAAAPAPYTVHRMLVSFDGVPIVPGRTIAYHKAGGGSDLAFEGRPVGASVEYQVELLSQNPSRLIVNEGESPPAATAVKPSASGPDPGTLALFVVAALAAGALVYCLLLLLGRRPVAKS